MSAKQPRLVSRPRPLLLQENASPHTAQRMAAELEKLLLECMRSSRPGRIEIGVALIWILKVDSIEAKVVL